jgi:hypothetical protein
MTVFRPSLNRPRREYRRALHTTVAKRAAEAPLRSGRRPRPADQSSDVRLTENQADCTDNPDEEDKHGVSVCSADRVRRIEPSFDFRRMS